MTIPWVFTGARTESMRRFINLRVDTSDSAVRFATSPWNSESAVREALEQACHGSYKFFMLPSPTDRSNESQSSLLPTQPDPSPMDWSPEKSPSPSMVKKSPHIVSKLTQASHPSRPSCRRSSRRTNVQRTSGKTKQWRPDYIVSRQFQKKMSHLLPSGQNADKLPKTKYGEFVEELLKRRPEMNDVVNIVLVKPTMAACNLW